MRDISPDEIEEFIREHCPKEHWKDPSKIRPWINWMMSKDCIEAFTDDGQSILAVLCSRMTNTENVDEDFDIDPVGDCLAVDLLLSTRDNILKSMATHLIRKYGAPQNVHWKRGERKTTVQLERVAKHILSN